MRAHSEFQRIYREGYRFFRNGLGFCVRKVRGIEFRYGISIPRRFGNAVERNLLRRRLREIIRNAASLPEGAEIVFCARKSCRAMSFPMLKDTCNWAFGKVGRLKYQDEVVETDSATGN